MNSHLPLLFANGFPASLETATQMQLQRFIPFLVQCSVGRETEVFSLPKWWPEHMPLITPDTKPACSDEDWLNILRSLIVKCYRYHDCEFLLHFCNDLTNHPHSTLRYINNFNGTTSLYIKGEGKLLCTFRNENISYDKKEQDKRKCLKPRIINAIKILDDDDDDKMVTTESVDIFVCENCSIELESLSQLQEHERVCEVSQITDSCITSEIEDNNQMNFLNYFKLTTSKGIDCPRKRKTSTSPTKQFLNFPYRTHKLSDVRQLKQIPFSSPAGKVLQKRLKLEIDEGVIKEKLNRTEKLCQTDNLSSQVTKVTKPFRITYKAKLNVHERLYRFPIGHILSKNDKKSATTINQTLLKTSNNIEQRECVIDLCSSDEEEESLPSNDKVKTNEYTQVITKNEPTNKIIPLSILCKNDKLNIVPIENVIKFSENSSHESSDYIDLCSSDEEETILPDLPNYPHLSIVRIPLGTRLTS